MSYQELARKLKDLNMMGDADPESRHVEEDKLLWQFVREIANSPSHFQGMAQLFVEYDKAERIRWYA